MIECLLHRGANVNAITKDGETALFYATRRHQYRIVRLLIRHETNLSIKNRFGDIAEDEALEDERTLAEFDVGREDQVRLSKKRGFKGEKDDLDTR
jgi:ankyrin repeat protein